MRGHLLLGGRVSSRVQAIAVVVASVVVAVVIGVYALVIEPQRDTAAAQAAQAVDASIPPPAHPLRVAFIGDSYTAGAGLGPHEAWPWLLGGEHGWTVWDFAEGGTGYVKQFASGGANACGTDACPNYQQVVPDVVAAGPDVVIVSGGRNDGTRLTPDLGKAITAVYAAIRKGLPNAKIIAVAPVLAADDTPGSFSDFKPAVKAAAEAVGGAYVDLGAPLGGHPELIQKDGVHPTAAGQQALAAAADKVLPKLG